MQTAPEPHKDDFVVTVALPKGSLELLCDRDVHPIRKQVQDIVDGKEAPLEWVTLPNVDEVVLAYDSLRKYVSEQRSFIRRVTSVPIVVQNAVHHYRWELVCLVTEGLYGDRKYRAARYYKQGVRTLRRLASTHRLKGYSKMLKHELVFALVEAGL